ncbi:LCP family protein [Mycolicibacterium komossense]|uniref:LCP family protein n=1 Tax=Mycolicibacterium komossense TaxID=1779 RepID=A0ABT3CM48_9MYCO|nr:LCP family protein [Mycolicibacterium komossense]MCV7230624.1 LCP family protein [Mycolicibacterium komossense]
MSDGDNATPGHHREPQPDGVNQWLTKPGRPEPAAAPWERLKTSPSFSPAAESAPERPAAPSGQHTGGITVADLIAKITGDIPESLQRATQESEAAPARDWPDDAAGLAGDAADPPTIPTPSAYASEIPDLAELARRRGVEETTLLPAVIDLALPARIGDTDDASDTPPPGHPKRRRALMFAGRSVVALIAIVALVLTGGAWKWTSQKNNNLKNVAALDLNSRDIVDPNAQFGDENFLIVGVDSRIGANSDMGAGDTEDAGGARSDTVMLVNIPADRKRVVAVSFPRDLAITPMKCEAWDPVTGKYGPLYDEDTQSYGPDEVFTETKLNSAYAFGGPKCLVKVIQKISGLSINRFMAVDFAGFATMVDALGGVEVCSTTPLEDYELGTVLANAGRQTIDGHTALNYVRARQVTTEFNGDYGRIKRQQLFLSSLLRSLISKETFFSLSKLNNVVNMFINDTYVDNIGTKDLVDLGQSLQGVSAGRITFVTVPTTGITDSSGNEEPRTDGIRALFDAIINDDPLPGENDMNATTAPVKNSLTSGGSTGTPSPAAPPRGTAATELVNAVTTAPADVTVHVSNSTGQTGLGTTVSTGLQEQGFNVDAPDDYPKEVPATTVMFSAGNEQAAATVAAAFGSPQIERVSGMGDVVKVVLGPDFDTVNAPPPSGSAVSVRISHGATSEPTELPEDLTVTNAADTTCE